MSDLESTIQAVVTDWLDQRRGVRGTAWQRTADGSTVGIDSDGGVTVELAERPSPTSRDTPAPKAEAAQPTYTVRREIGRGDWPDLLVITHVPSGIQVHLEEREADDLEEALTTAVDSPYRCALVDGRHLHVTVCGGTMRVYRPDMQSPGFSLPGRSLDDLQHLLHQLRRARSASSVSDLVEDPPEPD